MPKPKIHTSGNPVKPLPEKNRFIFRKVIPILRKIQEQKFWQEIPGEQSKIDRRINPQVKSVNRMLGKQKLSILSNKGKKDLNLLLYSRLKNIPEATIDDLTTLKREAISIIEKVKNRHFANNLISKTNAKKRIITEEILFWDLLTAKDKIKLNTIINYNLKLINSKGLISLQEYQQLVDAVFEELDKFNLRYVVAKQLKQEILDFPNTKERLSELSTLGKQRLFKYLNKLVNAESNIYSGKSQEKIKRRFVSRLLGID